MATAGMESDDDWAFWWSDGFDLQWFWVVDLWMWRVVGGRGVVQGRICLSKEASSVEEDGRR
ncbi:hypothetical protein CASFOL_034023 [Castilleja foliolosa]|uniref:Uncharacterized protein n=1 Tax=Castilleja foliolosa TaxID=1961234 RepID=A0ABD3BZA7_9LAMI